MHSILAALYYSEDQIRIFDELGYEHNPCAKGEGAWARGKCDCDPSVFQWVFLRRSSAYAHADYDGCSCICGSRGFSSHIVSSHCSVLNLFLFRILTLIWRKASAIQMHVWGVGWGLGVMYAPGGRRVCACVCVEEWVLDPKSAAALQNACERQNTVTASQMIIYARSHLNEPNWSRHTTSYAGASLPDTPSPHGCPPCQSAHRAPHASCCP